MPKIKDLSEKENNFNMHLIELDEIGVSTIIDKKDNFVSAVVINRSPELARMLIGGHFSKAGFKPSTAQTGCTMYFTSLIRSEKKSDSECMLFFVTKSYANLSTQANKHINTVLNTINKLEQESSNNIKITTIDEDTTRRLGAKLIG